MDDSPERIPERPRYEAPPLYGDHDIRLIEVPTYEEVTATIADEPPVYTLEDLGPFEPPPAYESPVHDEWNSVQQQQEEETAL